uniref:Cadherin related family member 4 n=1 Tax=Ictidomys tridecemlineatus TaxID=43179 RepID=A0A287DFM1_ICTTR
ATLNYQLWFHSPPGLASLCLRDRVLEVNATLDCDTPGTCFQHAASILVLDGGQPQMTREIHLLGTLDYEQQRLYRLTILLIDHGQDWDPTYHRSGSCTITIEVEVPSVMTPLLVRYTETFWQPEPWFVVVLTATGALLLLALGWLVNRLLQRLTQVLQAPSKSAQALRLNSIQGNEGSIELEAPRMEMSQEHFNGRAQDARTGQDYLFNMSSKASLRRWL